MIIFHLKKEHKNKLISPEINWSSLMPEQDIIMCCHYCFISLFKLRNIILIVEIFFYFLLMGRSHKANLKYKAVPFF